MAETTAAKPRLPWWVRYSRWRPQSSNEGSVAESNLLALNSERMVALNVPVGSKKEEFIHTVIGGSEDKPTLVMAPGYAAGLGFFWRNFDGLSSHFRLLAFDWLGTGLSGRPPFTANGRESAEDFFLKSLQEWRQKMGLGKFILMGHSLGGYLSASYALRYPEHVEHLILVCPAGVPEEPANWQNRFLERASSTRKAMMRMFMWAWDRGVTPGSVIRFIGPWGPGLIDKYINGRFRQHGQPLDDKEKDAFQPYFYQIIAAPGSGEYALRHLLAPGAWAYAPLARRLHELKVPVTFIYGSEDWMDPKHAVKLCQEIKAQKEALVSSDMKVEIIGDAGHFVFLEQPELFNRAVLDACAPYLGPAAEGVAAAAMPHAREETRSADSSRWGYAAAGPEAEGAAAAAAARG